jgi:hypothetical protein
MILEPYLGQNAKFVLAGTALLLVVAGVVVLVGR